MRFTQLRGLLVVVVAATGTFVGGSALADPYEWTIGQVQQLVDVTPSFHGGAGQLSTIDSITPTATGIQLEVTYRIGQEADPFGENYGLGFSRVSLQSCCFDAPGLDLSAFTSSSLKVTTSIDVTAQSFIQTDFTEDGATIDDGDANAGETFSFLFWEHNDGLAAGGPTDVDFDFSSGTEFDGDGTDPNIWNVSNPQPIQGTNAIRAWGLQFPSGVTMAVGQPVAATITIEGVVPEPATVMLVGLAVAGAFASARRRG